jgi:hypothetical protein
MKALVQDHVLFISLNPAEHVALTLPGSMLDAVNKSGKATADDFLFFANKDGSLLRIRHSEYKILKSFAPQSPFDEALKKLVSEYFLVQESP